MKSSKLQNEQDVAEENVCAFASIVFEKINVSKFKFYQDQTQDVSMAFLGSVYTATSASLASS